MPAERSLPKELLILNREKLLSLFTKEDAVTDQRRDQFNK